MICCYAFAKAQNYTSYFTGSTTDVSPETSYGVCLMGGATESDPAMVWFLEKANGGDILVLRASGSDGYNDYFFSDLGVTVNSVESIVINNAAGATDAYVLDKIEKAEAIWFAGGDQWNYVNYFKDNEVEILFNAHITQGKPIGGTSAGMAILGDYYFNAQNGTVTSAQALNNPYDARVSIGSEDFINIAYLDDVITDTHFDDPNRKGRATAFLARVATDNSKRSFGIASEEYTAVCIEQDGKAYVYGDYPSFEDYAYFMQANCSDDFEPENCSVGEPLDWNINNQAVKVYRVPGTENGAYYFDLSNWSDGAGGTWYNWWAQNGSFGEEETADASCEVLSIEEEVALDLQVYPNPFLDFINIQVSETATYEIFNSLGKLLKRGQLTSDNNRVELKTISKGIYFLKLSQGQKQQLIKVIKE